MIQLNAGNVLLKPSQRKQLMAWLKRAMKLGSQIGKFTLRISLFRTGKTVEVRADVRDSAGAFECKARRTDWRDALRDISRMLVSQLHSQRIGLSIS